jgi:hypothetical protein
MAKNRVQAASTRRVRAATSKRLGLASKGAETPDSPTPPPPTRGTRVPRWTFAIVGVAALVAVAASSDRGRSVTDPLVECEDYAAALRRCFGEKAAMSAARPPPALADRAAAAKRCTADRARIERACR